MLDLDRVFTPSEASVLTEIGLKTLHNAIDKGVIESGRTRDRKLTRDDVLLLTA